MQRLRDWRRFRYPPMAYQVGLICAVIVGLVLASIIVFSVVIPSLSAAATPTP